MRPLLCSRVCACVCVLLCVYMYSVYLCICVCARVRVTIFVFAVHVYTMNTCVHVCMYACVHVCMFARMTECVCACVCVYVCACIVVYIAHVCGCVYAYVRAQFSSMYLDAPSCRRRSMHYHGIVNLLCVCFCLHDFTCVWLYVCVCVCVCWVCVSALQYLSGFNRWLLRRGRCHHWTCIRRFWTSSPCQCAVSTCRFLAPHCVRHMMDNLC